MKVFKTKKEFEKFRYEITDLQKSIGLVPTMGNLHQGHVELLKSSSKENDISILTIFVNPLQFAANEDFETYPKTLEKDLEKVAELAAISPHKEFVVFAPKSNEEIFGTNHQTNIINKELAQELEGKSRPTHFEGVLTVVFKLFQISKAHYAYFGKKDYQQLILIKKMVNDLTLPIKIRSVQIYRAESGLALSSRNSYLTDGQKQEALNLKNGIKSLANHILETFSRDKISLPEIEKKIKEITKNKNWDYLEVRLAKDLSKVKEDSQHIVILGAYRVSTIRLLDNMELKI
jgi:pantoate--beta-alanine ligase